MPRTIITIGRQFGSNGRSIGKLVADKLGAKFYDKEILKEAAKNSGVCEEILNQLDEKPNKSLLYSVVMDPYSFGYFGNQGYNLGLGQQAFQATYDTIKNIAENDEKAVIVGRCSDYILRENPKVLKVFIYAPIEERIKTVKERFNLTENKAKDQIIKEDKQRSSYYNYYSSTKWGHAESYDLCINSSIMSADDIADEIVRYASKC